MKNMSILVALGVVQTVFCTGYIALAAEASLHSSAPDILLRSEKRRAARLSKRVVPNLATQNSNHALDQYLRLRSRKRSLAPVQKDTSATPADRRRARMQARGIVDTTFVTSQLLRAINTERATHGVFPLTSHHLLDLSAQRHAEDMRIRGYFSHTNIEGLSVKDRIKKTGYGNINLQDCSCSVAWVYGENIAQGQKTVTEAMESWMTSTTGHREAILSVDHEEIGIGIAGDTWVLNFGTVKITPLR